MNSILATCARAVLIVALTGSPVAAQMYLPDPRIDLDESNDVYFGSTKDTDGRFLSGVTAEIAGDNATFVMVTDDAGRFKIRVPKSLPAAQLKFNCSKPGYRLVRVTKRPPRKPATSPVQADCVLTPKPAAP